jgi:hypothetical protein
MSTASERYIPGASSSYSQDDFCEICSEVTCECCRRSIITPCCDNLICASCLMGSIKTSNKQFIVDCKLCETKSPIPKSVIIKYLKKLNVSELDFKDRIVKTKKN